MPLIAKRVRGIMATVAVTIAGLMLVSPVTASASSIPDANAVTSVTTTTTGGSAMTEIREDFGIYFTARRLLVPIPFWQEARK
jgi:hypothetical protein